MNNGDIYNLVLFVANKEQRGGYLKISDFNLQLRIKNTILLREKLGLTNDYGVGTPITGLQKDVSTMISDEVNVFKKQDTLTFSSGVAPLPTDYFRYDSVRVSGAYEDVDILTGGEVGRRINNPITAPDDEFPAGEFIGKTLKIYPSSINTADIVYYRYPTTPVFDYYIDARGNIQYLEAGEIYTLQAGETGSAGQASGQVTSTSVELEWSDPCKVDIAFLILTELGINIQRQDVVGIADAKFKQGV